MDKMRRLEIARDTQRITAIDFIDILTDSFIELHGDRTFGDDKAIISGIGKINDLYVTVIAQEKGKEIEDKIKRNFAMAHPEGYRKSLRMIKQAEKFNRPIITIIDTAGAYPGIESEERGQASSIATMLYELSDLKVPVIAVVLSEGGSGGALALAVADYIYCMENAYYSVISPEGYAEILYKSKKSVEDIIEDLPIFAKDLLDLKIIDEIIEEPEVGLTVNISDIYAHKVKQTIYDRLMILNGQRRSDIVESRYKRFRKYGK